MATDMGKPAHGGWPFLWMAGAQLISGEAVTLGHQHFATVLVVTDLP